MTDDAVAKFVERQKRERVAAGLPPTITDARTLAVIAALVARRGGDAA